MEYNELYHHGVKGQKWGVRRYQNYDGTMKKSGSGKNNGMSSEQKKKLTKALIGGAIAATTVTALVVYAKKNPEQILQAKLLAQGVKIKANDLSKQAVQKGKDYIAGKKATKLANKAELEAIKSMSPEQLRAKLNEENLRNQYTKIVSNKQNTTKNKVNKALKTAGAVSAGMGTVVGLANNAKNLKRVLTPDNNQNQNKKKR